MSGSRDNVDGNESNNGEEEEEVLVYVQFEDRKEASALLKAVASSGDEIKQLINTSANAHPTCIVGGTTFSGQHQINLGTVLFFGAKQNDRNNVKLMGTTDRVLKFTEEKNTEAVKNNKTAEGSMEVDVDAEVDIEAEGQEFTLV